MQDFAQEDVFEPEMAAVVLKFDLAARVNRLAAFPVILQRYVIDNQFVVEP